jgi:CRP-like cAMP-binding protein
MAYIRGRRMPRSATVTANTDITVMKIDPHQLNRLSEQCQSHFNQSFMFVLAERLRMSDDRVSKLIS